MAIPPPCAEGVFHDGFKYFSLGFNADLRNFKILNTNAKDNDMFYGTAYVTGPVAVYGPIDNLNIEANVTSNKGNAHPHPARWCYRSGKTQDYIQFVSKMAPPDSTTGCPHRFHRPEPDRRRDQNGFQFQPHTGCDLRDYL